ncbi:MAG: TrkH family potassium uptake protein [Methanomicrobiales archaeon]|nr:TrkH family potassium uptake protein [Methanomicrobiales archaeon]
MYELVSPVNSRGILKYLGLIMIGIGGVTAFPFLVALLFSEWGIAALYAVIACTISLSGYAISRLLPDYELQWKDAMVIAALIFPLSSLLSAIPFAASTGMPFLDAYFEAVSGLTTTGLSVAPADVGPVFLFARSWLQWIGGIGIVLIVISVLIPPGVSAFRLFTVNIGDQKLRPGVVGTAILLAEVYGAITIAAFLLLYLGGMPLFDAVCHALCTVSTGGFSTRAASIAAFPGPIIPLAITLSCIMGALNFALFPRMLHDPRELPRGIQVRYFILFASAGTLLLTIILAGTAPLADAFSIAAFQGFSAITTAGFATVDIGSLPAPAKAVLIVMMWIGGCVGSTAGGIKILRIVIIMKLTHLVFIRFFLPKEVLSPLRVRDTTVENDELQTLIAFVALYFTILAGSSFVFMLYGFPLDNALFEVSSALGTVGMSSGITSSALPAVLKSVLIVDMLLGRIEIIPLCILLFPRTWVKG